MNKKLFALLIVTLFIFGCVNLDITDEEKQLLLTVEDFAEYDIIYSEEYTGDFSKKGYEDKSIKIKYEYDPPDNLNVTYFYLISSIEFDKTEIQAIESFSDGILAYHGGAIIGGGKIEEIKDFIELGDQTYFAHWKQDDKLIGNVLKVRRGNKIYSLIMGGMYIDKPEILEELMSEKLSDMEHYN